MNYQIKVIEAQHDHDICKIIEQVGQEYGAIGDGFGPSDTEVKAMSHFYKDEQASCYFVALIDGMVVGGAGIAAFDNSVETCELRKLFLLPSVRGVGVGQQLTKRCLEYAKLKGYQQCYLDTLNNMHQAIGLYKKLGFVHLPQPLQGTIHNGCDVWMLKSL